MKTNQAEPQAKAAHTPGPWRYDRDDRDDSYKHRVYCGEDDVLANILDDTRTPGAANARLIAAAPELLAALKEMLPHIETVLAMMPESDGRDIIASHADFARAAIAKAEGAK